MFFLQLHIQTVNQQTKLSIFKVYLSQIDLPFLQMQTQNEIISFAYFPNNTEAWICVLPLTFQ
jgi:hypothetical protein